MAKQLCYRKLQSKNIRNLFVKVCNLATYFKPDDVKKHMRENIVPVIDRGVFHNYVHVCKQLFLCDTIRSHCGQLTPLSQVSHLFVMELKRKERSDR